VFDWKGVFMSKVYYGYFSNGFIQAAPVALKQDQTQPSKKSKRY
jgi:hypothetical protein